MTFTDIFLILAWTTVVYIFVRSFWKLQQVIQEKNQEIIESIKARISFISEEEHNGVYYWFDKDNNFFIAQGKTSDEIVNHIKQRYKSEHIFIMPDYSSAIVAPNCSVISIDQLTVNLK